MKERYQSAKVVLTGQEHNKLKNHLEAIYGLKSNLRNDYFQFQDFHFDYIENVVENLSRVIFRSEYLPEMLTFEILEECAYSINRLFYHMNYFESIKGTLRLSFVESLHDDFWKMVQIKYKGYQEAQHPNR